MFLTHMENCLSNLVAAYDSLARGDSLAAGNKRAST